MAISTISGARMRRSAARSARSFRRLVDGRGSCDRRVTCERRRGGAPDPGATLGGANGAAVLRPGVTVFDTAADVLLPGRGADWFLFDPGAGRAGTQGGIVWLGGIDVG